MALESWLGPRQSVTDEHVPAVESHAWSHVTRETKTKGKAKGSKGCGAAGPGLAVILAVGRSVFSRVKSVY